MPEERTKILVIDDDPNICQLVRLYLEKENYQVECAYRGDQGLKMVQSVKPALIVLDIMLPGMDGFAVCRKLRETLDIPILLVSARQEDIDKIKGLGMGADGYITKPFSPSVLVAHIKANLAQYDRLRHRQKESQAKIEMGK